MNGLWQPSQMTDGFLSAYHAQFAVPKGDYANMSVSDQDNYDLNKLYEILENEILPMYYDRPDERRQNMKNAMDDSKSTVQF
jgi:hypothetical protein